MTHETAFLVGCLCGAFVLSIGCGLAMRALYKRERDSEIFAAYRENPRHVELWLAEGASGQIRAEYGTELFQIP